MPLFLNEDETSKFGKRSLILPKDLVDHLRDQRNLYSGKEYKSLKGYKRLNAILDDDYNAHGENTQHGDSKTISFSDAKRIDHDIRHMSQSPDNVEYAMIGGDRMRDFVSNSLDSLRNSVRPVKAVPEVPKLSKKDVMPQDIKKSVKIGNAEVELESKQFNNKIKEIF